MKEITLSLEKLANQILTSYKLNTKEQHMIVCSTIRNMVGDDIYDEIAKVLKRTDVIGKVQKVVDGMVYDKNKERFVGNLYWKVKAIGLDVCLLNDKYLTVEGVDIHFVNNKRKMSYTAVILGE